MENEVKVIKCKEKDVLYNINELCRANVELPGVVSNPFVKGRWFYFQFIDKSFNNKEFNLRGKYLNG